LKLRYGTALAVSVAIHLLVALAVVWRPEPAAPRPVTPARTIEVFAVAPIEDARYPGLNPLDPAADDWTLPRDSKAATLQIGSFNVDIRKISERAHVLFPFVTPGLSLEVFGLAPPSTIRSTLLNPLASRQRQGDPKAAPPLNLRSPAMQALIDTRWSRHERWQSFEPIGVLAQAHNPDLGQLPALLRMYCEQNSLQPYADTGSRDPRLWAQLGLAADHVSFISFIRHYADEHPSTRATTELLFLLDRVTEANRDALRVMLDSDPPETLGWTRAGNPAAYELIVRIRWFYQRELDRLGLRSEAAIDVFYERARLAILDGILRTTPDGYRANDARFLIGAIHWRQRSVADALRSWRAITLDPQDTYVTGALPLARALQAATNRGMGAAAPPDAALVREIDRILANEHGRWVSFSAERLAHFGYRFDSF
jgi:hypothetical protein